MSKTTVGLLPPGTKFTTCLTRRPGMVLEHDERLGTLVSLPIDGTPVEKEIHPDVVVEVSE